jgi:hypothetical protein
MTSSGMPVAPSALSSLTASPWNAVVAMRPAAVPVLASSMASWRLHDVQDPQSAEPAKTTSQTLPISAMSSGGAGVAAFALRRCTIVFTP